MTDIRTADGAAGWEELLGGLLCACLVDGADADDSRRVLVRYEVSSLPPGVQSVDPSRARGARDPPAGGGSTPRPELRPALSTTFDKMKQPPQGARAAAITRHLEHKGNFAPPARSAGFGAKGAKGAKGGRSDGEGDGSSSARMRMTHFESAVPGTPPISPSAHLSPPSSPPLASPPPSPPPLAGAQGGSKWELSPTSGRKSHAATLVSHLQCATGLARVPHVSAAAPAVTRKSARAENVGDGLASRAFATHRDDGAAAPAPEAATIAKKSKRSVRLMTPRTAEAARKASFGPALSRGSSSFLVKSAPAKRASLFAGCGGGRGEDEDEEAWPVQRCPKSWRLRVAWAFNGTLFVGGVLWLALLLRVLVIDAPDGDGIGAAFCRNWFIALAQAFVVQDSIKVLLISFISPAFWSKILKPGTKRDQYLR